MFIKDPMDHIRKHFGALEITSSDSKVKTKERTDGLENSGRDKSPYIRRFNSRYRKVWVAYKKSVRTRDSSGCNCIIALSVSLKMR